MADVWKKAEEAVEVSADTGDILSVLRRVEAKYAAHIFRIGKRSDHGNLTAAQKRGLAYYNNSGDAVQKLIEQ
jgi:hypothetical protein